jgi:hypothetical protein
MKIDYIELIEDSKFETGFHLLGINPTINHRKTYKHLNYGGKAKLANRKIWQMAQWWTPYNLINGNYREEESNYIYETPSRKITLDKNNQKLLMELKGSKEYKEPRNSPSQPWSHLLIEQDFIKDVKIDELKKVVASLTFNIESFEDKMKDKFNPNLHAAQFLWYFVIADKKPNMKYGDFKEYFWFGVPLFDSRFDFIDESMIIDQGGEGTTGKLIYSMANKNYLNEKIQFNKEYHLSVDILPFIKKAMTYAKEKCCIKVDENSNYQITYMNLGWEIPGMYDVSSYIKKISVKAYYKK